MYIRQKLQRNQHLHTQDNSGRLLNTTYTQAPQLKRFYSPDRRIRKYINSTLYGSIDTNSIAIRFSVVRLKSQDKQNCRRDRYRLRSKLGQRDYPKTKNRIFLHCLWLRYRYGHAVLKLPTLTPVTTITLLCPYRLLPFHILFKAVVKLPALYVHRNL